MPIEGSTTEIVTTNMSKRRSRRYKHLTKWQGIHRWFRLPGMAGHLIPVDLGARYRRHLVWAKTDGDKLLQTVTSRFQSTSVFLSLFVSTTLGKFVVENQGSSFQLTDHATKISNVLLFSNMVKKPTGVFFSPAEIVNQVRQALKDGDLNLKFFAGIALNISFVFSLSALIANVTAWAIFVVLSKPNASTILRSSLGLYAAQLPNRLVLLSFYLFLVWVSLFWFLIMPLSAALMLTVMALGLVSHIASTFSAMGEIIMATSAMSDEPILSEDQEEKMGPKELYHALQVLCQ